MQSDDRKILNLLGLAQKAGKIASGEFSTEKAVKSGQAKMAVISADASGNTKKKFHNMCEWYHVPVIEIFDKASLGHCLGRSDRTSLAVTDEGLARAIMKAAGAEDTRR